MPDPIIEQVVISSHQNQENAKTPEVQVDRGKPYFYHTTPIENLGGIFKDKKLKSSEGKPIMFTADKIDDKGDLTVNGLTDPSYDILVGRSFKPGRAILVFDNRVRDNPGFQAEDGEHRYPQVQEQPTEDTLAVIVFEEEMPEVWKTMEESGVDIPIVKKDDWENYAYGSGETEVVGELSEAPEAGTAEDGEIVGGLYDPEAKSSEETTEPATSETTEKINDNPGFLLVAESVGIDDFFGMNFDRVYAKLHSLQSLPADHPSYNRWNKIREIWEMGKDEYRNQHPDDEEIKFS